MDVDNVVIEYAVPIQSTAHLVYPSFKKQGSYKNTKDDVISEMSSNATGSENIQVQALEKEIKSLSEEQVALGKKIVTLNTAYNADAAERQKLYDLLQTCEWQSDWRAASKKYKCGGTYHSKEWYAQQTDWLNKYWQRMEATKADIAIAQKRKDEIDRLLPQKQSELDASRTSASRAAMTPDELKNYDAAQKKATAEAEALKIQAEAQAKSSATKSKVFLIVGVVLALAIVGGGIMWVVKRKPKIAAPNKAI